MAIRNDLWMDWRDCRVCGFIAVLSVRVNDRRSGLFCVSSAANDLHNLQDRTVLLWIYKELISLNIESFNALLIICKISFQTYVYVCVFFPSPLEGVWEVRHRECWEIVPVSGCLEILLCLKHVTTVFCIRNTGGFGRSWMIKYWCSSS